MNIVHILKTYDPEADLRVEYELQIDDDGIRFALTDDHLLGAGQIGSPAVYPRSVKIELRPSGGLNVLLYRTDHDEPRHFILEPNGLLVVPG